MTTALFLVIFAATLSVSGWLGARLVRANIRTDELLAEDARAEAVNDAADMAETACDWGGTL